MASTQSQQLPHFELFQRMQEIPMVELALAKSASTYSWIKYSNQLMHWVLSTAESSLTSATHKAAPYARKLNAPISFVDHTLCRGLDTIEKKVPIVKEQPEMILEKSYMLALEKMRPAVSTISYANDLVASQATNIKNASWKKANEILSTEYGTVAVHSVDTTAFLVEMLIDKYFPPTSEEKFPESVSMEEDRLLHTLQTVGRLSNKAARRVYAHVVYHMRTLRPENIRSYLAGLLEFLQLAHYIGVVNERIQDFSPGSSPKAAHEESS